MDDSCRCPFCKHWYETEAEDNCTAFPEGIPDDILLGLVQHDCPFPGDHCVRFAPATSRQIAALDRQIKICIEEFYAQPD